MTTSSADAVAERLAQVIGGSPRTEVFPDRTTGRSLRIDRFDDKPWKQVRTYATVGLSDHPMLRDKKEFRVRVELVGCAYAKNEDFSFAVAEAGFHIMRTSWLCMPGAVLPDVLSRLGISSDLPHVYFNNPFLWDDRLGSMKCGDRTIAWLLMVPMSDAEYRYRQANGAAMLERLYQSAQIDIFNLARKNVA